MQLPHNPSILFLDVYPREMKTEDQTKTYKLMSMAPLFMIAKNGTNPNGYQLMTE
jgi:hypothetical protein